MKRKDFSYKLFKKNKRIFLSTISKNMLSMGSLFKRTKNS